MDVGIYTFGKNIPLPSFGTDLASCFDLAYQNPEGLPINGVDSESRPQQLALNLAEQNGFLFPPGYRILVPTCMIFDLPEGHDMRVHPRSGISFSKGLTLINCEGVIDEDYTKQLFIPMINLSTRSVLITIGTRLAQAEIRPSRVLAVKDVYTGLPWANPQMRPNFVRLDEPPAEKTNRTGGFGSTGV